MPCVKIPRNVFSYHIEYHQTHTHTHKKGGRPNADPSRPLSILQYFSTCSGFLILSYFMFVKKRNYKLREKIKKLIFIVSLNPTDSGFKGGKIKQKQF